MRDWYRERRSRLVRHLERTGVDALLVMRRENVRYLTGFTGDDSALIVSAQSATLVTDGRYVEQAGTETCGVRVVSRQGGLMASVGRLVRRDGSGRLGVEAEAISVAQAEDLRKALGRVEMVPTRRVVEDLRIIKDVGEVALIRRAIRIAEKAFLRTLPQLRPGLTERAIARLLEDEMLELGAESPAFPTIVAAGARTSLPHARPTERRVESGDAIIVDWGARVDGYHSDLTRMVFMGRIPELFERLLDICLGAQRKGISQIRPGRPTSTVDRCVRAFLKARRHNKFFTHGLGHGLGLAVHESPNLGRLGGDVLRPGMVCTVEPGLYLPGRGGVRIEDDILVTRQGHEVLSSLTRSPEDLLIRLS